MANVIRIKRRASGGSGSPSSLGSGELAVNEVDGKLYYGKGNNGSGTATSIVILGQEGAINGNQTVTLSGDAAGSGTTAITVTLANSGVSANTYTKVTVDAKGRVTNGAALAASDIPTLTASKVSDFDDQVRTSRLDQLAVPAASVSLNNQRLTSLADPASAQDAATKAYVDASRQGLDVKASVRAATVAVLPSNSYASGVITAAANGAINTAGVDGVTDLAIGERLLIKDEAVDEKNGLYDVTAVGDASNPFVLTRSADANTGGANGKVTSGLFTFVEEGAANAGSGWTLTTNGAITLGTTPLAFVQFSGAGQITAGDGLTKSGNTLNAVGTANRVTVNADNIDIASSYVGQSSITTLGTIGTGVWNGTTIGVGYGGTGLASYTAGDLVYASGATMLAKLAAGTAGQVLVMNAGATAPAWADGLDGGSF